MSTHGGLFAHPGVLKARETCRRNHVAYVLRCQRLVPESVGDKWVEVIKACDPKLTPTRAEFNAVLDRVLGRH